MRGTGVAIATAMFAATVGVDAVTEGDVRAVVVTKEGFGLIGKELRLRCGRDEVFFVDEVFEVGCCGDSLEAVRRADGGAAPVVG